MKRTHVHCMVAVALGLLVVAMLLRMPSASGAQMPAPDVQSVAAKSAALTLAYLSVI